MKLFEYEAKAILQKYGIGIPKGKVVQSAEAAVAAAKELNTRVFIKSQITVSGRGKAGGIISAANPTEAGTVSASLIGKIIKGIKVNTLLVEERLDLKEQYYASITVDRQAKCFVALASTSGGVDIEEVANTSPEKISRLKIDPQTGLTEAAALKMLEQFKLS